MQAKFSTLVTFLVASLKHPSSVAALTSVGLHAVLGVALPSLPLFAEGTFVDGDVVGQNSVGMVTLPDQVVASRVPAIVTTPQLAYGTVDGNGVGIPTIQPGNLPIPTGLPQGTPVTGQPQNQSSRGSRPYNYSSSGNQRSGNTLNNAQTKVITRTPSRSVPNSSTTGQNTQTNPNNQNQEQQNGERLAQHEIIKDFKVRDFPLHRAATLLPGNQGTRAFLSIEEPTESAASSGPITRRRDTPQVVEEQNDALAGIEARRTLWEPQGNNSGSETNGNTSPAPEPNNFAATQSVTIAGNYPQDACLKELSGTSVYQVLVNPGGSVTNVRRVQSGGYRMFNQQAASQVANYSFPAVTQATPYRVTVTFDYEANKNRCPGLRVQPQPAARPTPQPSPTPERAPVSQPQPSPTPERAPVSQPQPSPTPERDRSPAATPEPPNTNAADLQPEPEATTAPPRGDNAASEPTAE